MKEQDGVQTSSTVFGRFTPEEISPTSQRRETEKDENPELTVKKKKESRLEPNQVS